MTTEVPTFYKLSDAHKALGPGAPSEDTLRREVKKGNLRAKRIGRCLRVTNIELARWAAADDPLSTGTEPTAKPYSGAPQADTLPVRLGTGGVSGEAS